MGCQSEDIPTCPFCPFSDPDSDFVAEHVQYCHPENGSQPEPEPSLSSPFMSRTSIGDQISNCAGNYDQASQGTTNLPSRDAEIMNDEALIAFDNASSSPHALPKVSTKHTVHQKHRFARQFSTRGLLSQSHDRHDSRSGPSSNKAPCGNIKRLGRADLGPYAQEKRMPSWLHKMLEEGTSASRLNRITPDGKIARYEVVENETVNVIPAIAQLCGQDKSVSRAFLCSAHVHQISKMPGEGGFCGYRNIQMLISYIQESCSPGYDRFATGLPTILQLQDMIEHAWDLGFNSVGRTETGGIKDTRKYIGTSEAQALFLSLGIQCEASIIGRTDEIPAHCALLSHVAAYFKSACPLDKSEKVVLTNLPPVYLQHHGHSLTVVGFEIRDKGSANILVFDPTFKTPPLIKYTITSKIKTPNPAEILKGFRRGVNYLQKYKTFELLKLCPPGIPPEH